MRYERDWNTDELREIECIAQEIYERERERGELSEREQERLAHSEGMSLHEWYSRRAEFEYHRQLLAERAPARRRLVSRRVLIMLLMLILAALLYVLHETEPRADVPEPTEPLSGPPR